jgi:ubiquinone/menaquinone biosynthesis C-methylase UbiE
MQSLKLKYSKLFAGLDGKPDSYREIADQYEWAEREVRQHVEQYRYDDFNAEYLPDLLNGERGKIVVECGCGLGGNILPFADRHRCIGVDYSKVALKKLRRHTRDMFVTLGDISAIPLRDESADYVIIARVLFVHEDLNFIAAILRDVQRVLKPQGKVVIINDFSSGGVRLFNSVNDFFARVLEVLRRRQSTHEFMLYYFSHDDLRQLLAQSGMTLVDTRLCNVHQGVYHLTYHNKLFGLLLRANWKHYRIRRKDHFERVRLSSRVNDAYPLGLVGRAFAHLVRRWRPSLAALSLAGIACKSAPTNEGARTIDEPELSVAEAVD